ncbi:MAG TPA: TolC family protein [Chitinophagaceae bacterium]|nr:TolC family protein [Chitinophagaceae bacterium]
MMPINQQPKRRRLQRLMIILLVPVMVHAQSPLTIDECYTLAKQNYPLVKQHDLIEKTKEYSVENAAKGYLPQFTVSGQATYQSDVTSIPLTLPGVTIPSLSKDQYKIVGEADQTVFDGGSIKYQKQAKQASASIQQQSLEVNLYSLKDRINQLFFGVLLIDEQLKLNTLQQKDIQNGIDKTQALVTNGTAFRSSLDELKASLIKADQSRIELQSNRAAYLNMLGLFINRHLDESTVLTKPQPQILADSITRPELSLYDYQKTTWNVQDKMLHANILPKLQLFAQGGYGKPGLNLLKTDFSFYYIAGIRLNWSLSSLYTYKNDRLLSAINRKDIDIQKETFIFNTHIALKQQSAEASKYEALINKDNDIIALRNSVKNAAAAQLANGVITPHDYIAQVDAEDLARQNLVLHQIQLLQAQYNFQTTSGN